MERTLGPGTYKFLVFYEFFGTALLVYAVNISYNFGGDPTVNQFGISFMIFALILLAGPITGAHFNPAITTGVLVSNKNILP